MPICQGPVPSGVAVLFCAMLGALLLGLAKAAYRARRSRE